ncbi:DUF2235 domain-containing protein [Antrihabitans stalactiti]|uniref:DUF2235 domain-containing protein n=1 Tax=Antrihabitans stalactiti TaxID=2584121 RepID=UPI0030B857E4
MKKIVYCCDGTWGKKRRSNTNVYRLYTVLKRTNTQMVIYDKGVGTSGSWIRRMQGGAFGAGLNKGVKRGYRKIAEVYDPGDELYLFGFSRGAFTARSIAGMIAFCGLPTVDKSRNIISMAFKGYRARTTERKWHPPAAAEFVDPGIMMIGVWETVGTLGIPAALLDRHDDEKWGFHDTNLHEDVLNAYHALALDERRRQFTPSLWHARAEGLHQVWFAGDHTDVGGGISLDPRKRFHKPKHQLSDIPFAWMLSKAAGHGLEIRTKSKDYRALPQPTEAALDKIGRTWNPLWGRAKPRVVDPGSIVANSVDVRVNLDPEYNPPLTITSAGSRRLADETYQVELVVRSSASPTRPISRRTSRVKAQRKP